MSDYTIDRGPSLSEIARSIARGEPVRFDQLPDPAAWTKRAYYSPLDIEQEEPRIFPERLPWMLELPADPDWLERSFKPEGRRRTRDAAGVVFVAPDGRVLYMRRSVDAIDYADHWSFPAGRVEEGEHVIQAARREAEEKTGRPLQLHELSVDPIASADTPDGGTCYIFACTVPETFAPNGASPANSAYCWAPAGEPPTPRHPGLEAILRS